MRNVLKRVVGAVALKMPLWGYTVSSALIVGVLYLTALTPAPALALPEGRHYELVSPAYKGGYASGVIKAVAPDGESVAFYSPGSFAGAPNSGLYGGTLSYLARRGVSGWSTVPLMPPAGLLPYVLDGDVSSTLGSVLALGAPGANQEGATQSRTEEEVLLHSTSLPDTSANWELGGLVLKTFPEEKVALEYAGGSPDFCHILVRPTGATPSRLLPEEAGVTADPLYEIVRGCGGEPVSLRRVGLNNKDQAINRSCPVDLGDGQVLPSDFNAVADDGKEIFFSTYFTGCGGDLPSSHELFVRLDGSRTLEVSKPLEEVCSEVPCGGAASRASAHFVGASEDGSTVFFMTAAPLVPADRDNGNDLYMAKIGCPSGGSECEVGARVVTSLVQVSHDPNGGEAGVQGAVRVAPDGSRAYFVARGDLLEGAQRKALEGEGRAVPHQGADNLYVYNSVSEHLGFVGDLCSGRELSGAVEDLRCPTKTESDLTLWNGSEGEAQTAGSDGRFLVFATYAQLVAGDTDAARDVYRYDAVTGALERVSTGEHGYHANGNDDRFDASIQPSHSGGLVVYQYEMDNRAVSQDGSRIVFTSSEPLSPAATNGLPNVYEWHIQAGWSEGNVSLVSGGDSQAPVEYAVISPDGRDLFFNTTQRLVAQDTDDFYDLYDARLGAGFPAVPAQRQPCSSDACQGPLTNPAPLLLPGSVSEAPGQNFTAPAPATTVKPKAKVKKKPKKKRRKPKKSTKGKK